MKTLHEIFTDDVREIDFSYSGIGYNIQHVSIKEHIFQRPRFRRSVYIVYWGDAKRGEYASLEDLENMVMHDGRVFRQVISDIEDINLW